MRGHTKASDPIGSVRRARGIFLHARRSSIWVTIVNKKVQEKEIVRSRDDSTTRTRVSVYIYVRESERERERKKREAICQNIASMY